MASLAATQPKLSSLLNDRSELVSTLFELYTYIYTMVDTPTSVVAMAPKIQTATSRWWTSVECGITTKLRNG